MTRENRIHRFGFVGQGTRSRATGYARRPTEDSKRTHTKAACGVMMYPSTPTCRYAVCDRLFRSFPQVRRCWTCESKWHHLLWPE